MMCLRCKHCTSTLMGEDGFKYPVYACEREEDTVTFIDPQQTPCEHFELRKKNPFADMKCNPEIMGGMTVEEYTNMIRGREIAYDRTHCLECRNEFLCGLGNLIDWCTRYNVRVTVNTKYCKAFEPKVHLSPCMKEDGK